MIIDKIHRLFSSPKGNGRLSTEQIRQNISTALKSLNCKYTWEQDGDASLARFDFQSGHFSLRLEKDNPFARLAYPYFCETKLDNIDLVRQLCNRLNIEARVVNFIYTIDEKDNSVGIHIVAELLLNDDNAADILAETMRDIFGWQLNFTHNFHEMEARKEQVFGTDPEAQANEFARELFLIREQEISHQQTRDHWRENETKRISLSQWMNTAFNMPDFEPRELAVITDNVVRHTDEQAIRSFDLSSPIINPRGSYNANAAMLDLSFTLPKHPKKERHMSFRLQQERGGEDSLYYRVTATLMPLSAQPLRPLGSDENQAVVRTALMAYDLKSEEQKLEQFNYIWSETMSKMKNGDLHSLTEEQQILSECLDRDIAINIYRGRQLFLDKRYFEALLWLENAFHAMKDSLNNDIANSGNDNFFNVCYMIGFCYNELKQFDKAYYYLSFTLGLNHITYTEEYINSMVNSNDYRALPFIDGLMQEIGMQQQGDEDDDEEPMPDNVRDFMSFLKRRKAYVLVERGSYEEAKKLLKPMLDDADNSDFALSELAYIQRMEGADLSH